jgi:hypothetical protein
MTEMLVEAPISDPRVLIYEQLVLVMNSRSEGKGSVQSLSGLMAMIEPVKDESWFADLKACPSPEEDEDAAFWFLVRAVVRQLSRANLWAKVARAVVQGEEFKEALG